MPSNVILSGFCNALIKPDKFHGQVMDICFGYVASPTEALAIKAFSLTVLSNLATIYPEISPEIKLLIEAKMPY